MRGFNVEISKVQDQVSEPHLAQMRLQFWHDTLEKLFKGNVPKHPVAQELYEVCIYNVTVWLCSVLFINWMDK